MIEGAGVEGQGPTSPSLSGSSVNTIVTMSSLGLERIIESSYRRRGATCLEQHDRRLTQRIVLAEKEFTKRMDDRIKTRARETDADGRTPQSGKSSGGVGGRGVFAGAGCQPGLGGRHVGHGRRGTTSGLRTMEVKGICEYGQRFTPRSFTLGAPIEFAEAFVGKLQHMLPDDHSTIDRRRSCIANGVPSNFK